MIGVMIEKTALVKKAVTPYHIKWYDINAWANGEIPGKNVYIQTKYDGTHIQLSAKYGVRNHSAVIPNTDAIYGLIWLEQNDPDFQKLLEILNENKELVVTIELFGSKITPAGYHRNWPTPYDFRVLDVYFMQRFLEPIQWFDYMPKPAQTRIVDRVDFEELRKIALSDESYEGVVLKQYGDEFSQDMYYVGKGLRIAKFKPKELLSVPERFSRGKIHELFVEVRDELRKGNNTVEGIMEYLRNAHPELIGKKEERTRAIIAQIIKWWTFVGEDEGVV